MRVSDFNNLSEDNILFILNTKVIKVATKKTGEPVKNDTILLSIYSPQLVASQQEYLLAINNLEILKDSPFADIRQGAIDLAVRRQYLL